MRNYKWKVKKLSVEEQQALHVVAFIMDQESDTIKNNGGANLEASETTKMTFQKEHLKLHEALRAIADWLRNILASVL